jgi:hypothetical protein
MININGFLNQKKQKQQQKQINNVKDSSNIDIKSYVEYIKNNVKNKVDVSTYESLNNKFKVFKENP